MFTAILLAVARARLAMAASDAWLRTELEAWARPNGTITLNRRGNGMNDFGHYTEQFAASMAVSELLLQSAGGMVRPFPAWPRGKRASFGNLRAEGGFLVSARTDGSGVKEAEISSEAGRRFRMVPPEGWTPGGISVEEAGAGGATSAPFERDAGGAISFDPSAGRTYKVWPL